MNDEETREKLFLLLMDELDDQEAEQVLQRLAASAELRKVLAEYVRLYGFLVEHMPKIPLEYLSEDN